MRHLFFAFILILCLPFTAQAGENVLNIQPVQSENGLSAWLVEDHSVPVIALQFAFKGVGAALDPADKQGLSRLASNTMDEGAGTLDSQAFQKELRDLSIDFHFTSNRDEFGGEIKTLSKNKDRAFELLTLALTQPRFEEEPLTRMREANKSRIRSSLSDPDWMAARVLNDTAFAGHPYAQNSGGTLSSLDTITADDLRSFAKQLAKDQLVVAAAGDITKEELAALLDRIFGTLPQSSAIAAVPDMTLQNQGGIFLYKRDIPQTIIEILQPGIDRKDPDYQVAQVMNQILGSSGFGSRLTEEIRENRGLTYGIYSSFMDMDHADTLGVSTSTKNESAAEVLSLIKQEWQKMTQEPVSAKELEDAKSYLIGSLPLSLTSTDKIAELLLSLQLSDLPIDYLDQRENSIRSANADDVARVAQRLLNPDQFVTILVGAPDGLENPHIVETLPNVE